MGWGSGSEVLSQVWRSVREHIPEAKRQAVLVELMNVFAQHDCDTLMEVIDDEWPESEPAYEEWRGK